MLQNNNEDNQDYISECYINEECGLFKDFFRSERFKKNNNLVVFLQFFWWCLVIDFSFSQRRNCWQRLWCLFVLEIQLSERSVFSLFWSYWVCSQQTAWATLNSSCLKGVSADFKPLAHLRHVSAKLSPACLWLFRLLSLLLMITPGLNVIAVMGFKQLETFGCFFLDKLYIKVV